MAPLGELFSLGIYIVQQVGIVIGVGAETVLLALYLVDVSKAVHGYGTLPAVRTMQRWGLGLIVVSGAAAVLLHLVQGESAVLAAPAFLFKWTLVGVVIVLYAVEAWGEGLPGAGAVAFRGFAGAQWFALLIVHMMAPVVSWVFLAEIYAGWVAAYMLVWALCIYLMTPVKLEQKIVAPVAKAVAPPPAFVPASHPAPVPQPKVPLLVSVYKGLPPPPHAVPAPKPPVAAAPVAPRPAAAPMPPKPAPVAPKPMPPPAPAPQFTEESPDVPAIRVMPRTPAELQGENRGAVVQFD